MRKLKYFFFVISKYNINPLRKAYLELLETIAIISMVLILIKKMTTSCMGIFKMQNAFSWNEIYLFGKQVMLESQLI